MRHLTTMLLAAVLLAGCGDDSGDDTTTRAAGGPFSFENKPWVLTEGVADASQAPPTATFDGRTVTGFGGCNTYHAGYTATATTLKIGQIASTLMACVPPGDTVERAFTAALGKVAKWRVSGNELTLSNSAGKQLLRMTEATVTGDWTVTSLQVPDALKSPIPGTEITANFNASGELTGSGGCNEYSTTYSTDGNKITIKPATATHKHCETPAGVSEQEAHYLADLETATNFRLSGDQLALLRDDGTYAVSYVRR